MGEIADMMIDGILDWQTGEYIGDAVGYPRTYHSNDNRGRKKMHPQAAKQVRTMLNKVQHYTGLSTAVKQFNILDKFLRYRGLVSLPDAKGKVDFFNKNETEFIEYKRLPETQAWIVGAKTKEKSS